MGAKLLLTVQHVYDLNVIAEAIFCMIYYDY